MPDTIYPGPTAVPDELPQRFPRIVLKIGGRPSTERNCMITLADEIGRLIRAGIEIAVVHGGGARVTELSRRLGVEARFTEGVRATGSQDMLIADQVLAGEMNTELVRIFSSRGIPGVGLTGCDAELCTAEAILEHTGQVATTRTQLLELLWYGKLVPIIASVSQDAAGTPMNINADEFARGIAAGLQAPALVYISDIAGIRIREQIASRLDPNTIEQEIIAGEIRQGMIAKARAAAAGLQQGIGTVCIGDYAEAGDLVALLTEQRGTHVGTF